MDGHEEPAISPLEALCQRHGDPDLFPGEVRELYDAGKVLAAHKALRKHSENDGVRAAHQAESLRDLRLWVQEDKPPSMQTLNGVGSRLAGKEQLEDDGTYVATLWFVLLFIPLWPISSYLVAPAEDGGWYFLGRVPLVPRFRVVRTVGVRALVALLAVGGWWLYQARTHVDVHTVNGFDVPVLVTVGESERTLAPRQHTIFEDVPAAATDVSARVEAVEFDAHSVDLSRHVGQTVVYNVAGRAVLESGQIRYGVGNPPEGVLLSAQPVQALPLVDYPFITPPQEKSVKEGGFVQNSTLATIDDGAPAVSVVSFLLEEDRADHALDVAIAELAVHPDDAPLAYVAATYLLGDDPEAGLALFRGCLRRAPESVDLHRYYQELRANSDYEGVRKEYRKELNRHLDSALHHYLLGRLIDGAGGIHLFKQAIELDPSFEPTYRAYGHNAALAGKLLTAARMYRRYGDFGAFQAAEILDEQVRLALIAGRSHAEVEPLVQAVIDTTDSWDAHLLLAHLRVSARPADLEREIARIAALAGDEAPTLGLEASLALTAGALSTARKKLKTLAEQEGADAGQIIGVGLRLATSDGATAEDRSRVRSRLELILAPGSGTGEALLALALAEQEEWSESEPIAAWLETRALAQVARLIRRSSADSGVAALDRLGLRERAAASFALAYRLSRSGQAGQAPRLARLARRLSLPGELPWMRP